MHFPRHLASCAITIGQNVYFKIIILISPIASFLHQFYYNIIISQIPDWQQLPWLFCVF